MTSPQQGGARPPRRDLLWRLAHADRTRVFLAALVLVALGLFLPGVVGALVLYAVVAALAALLNLTWAVTPALLRVVRLAMLAALAIIATAKVF